MIPHDPFQVRLSGSGGQGIILAGVLLAEAGMYDGLHVVHTQSYGPAARLGAAKSEVVLSRREIAFPEVRLPDVLVCLSRDAYERYGNALAPAGLRIVDEQAVSDLASAPEGAIVLPIVRTARELGASGAITANVVALGALLALSRAVSETRVRRALGERVKPETLDLNQRALAAGLALGATVSVSGLPAHTGPVAVEAPADSE
ncbi:MAG TPA: 2-oxoacid:acceptor oxidoreductase family protein [Gemmatimonadales bacterium]|nr:2-oxoacid:acceptor oxidoreductase family protein [Gemmatimonadales bacterium]